jgi:hypothetical protein
VRSDKTWWRARISRKPYNISCGSLVRGAFEALIRGVQCIAVAFVCLEDLLAALNTAKVPVAIT